MEEIKNVEDLCCKINVSLSFLRYVLYVKKDNYITFELPKQTGGIRNIDAPKKELKYIQKKLLNYFEKCYKKFLNCQHGFIKGRSCVTNADNHVGKRFVINCDIKNFFNTIHFGRVRGLFMNNPFNFSNEVATTIAKITCHNGVLPQGAPTSPIISNMICYKMDKELNFIAKKNNCRYTRYADDITFSSNSEYFPEKIAKIKGNKIVFSERIVKTISGNYDDGFKINEKKSRICKRYVKQEVTGIIVNEKTNVEKGYVKNIRAILHNIKINGYIDSSNKTFNEICNNEDYAKKKLFNYLAGKLNYLKMVKGNQDHLYLKYSKIFNEVFKCSFFNNTIEMEIQKYAKKYCFVVNCGKGASTGTGFPISNGKILTSTHIIFNDVVKYDYDDIKEKQEFQVSFDKMEFVYLEHPELNKEVQIVDFCIKKDDYENDYIVLPNPTNLKDPMKISDKEVNVGDKIFMVGYPAFNGFKHTDLHIISAKVTGQNILYGRNLINTDISPRHGMSGGPVLNEKKEIVGIVYAGYEDFNSNENVGYISLVGIKI